MVFLMSRPLCGVPHLLLQLKYKKIPFECGNSVARCYASLYRRMYMVIVYCVTVWLATFIGVSIIFCWDEEADKWAEKLALPIATLSSVNAIFALIYMYFKHPQLF